MHTREEQLSAFNRLLDVMDKLRAECPWDKKQTLESLRINTIEEVYELSEAILANDLSEINKELGDILLHIVFYAKIASETNTFDIADVCHKLCDKLIYRHPHIYPPKDKQEVDVNTSEEVIRQWEVLKTKEKGGNKTILSGVPKGLPSLIKAYRIQQKAHGVGFDWPDAGQAWDKVKEEIQEFEAELKKENKTHREEEFGDLLFSLINVARLLKINPDNALETTNNKFIRRFNYIEECAKSQNKSLNELSLTEMDAHWNEAKAIEKQ